MGRKDNKKVFIIQPMGGRSEDEVLRERAEIISELTKRGYDTVESYFSDGAPIGCVHESIYYLGKSIERLCWADYIYLVPGWERGRGCVIEHAVAEAYHIPEVIL